MRLRSYTSVCAFSSISLLILSLIFSPVEKGPGNNLAIKMTEVGVYARTVSFLIFFFVLYEILLLSEKKILKFQFFIRSKNHQNYWSTGEHQLENSCKRLYNIEKSYLVQLF